MQREESIELWSEPGEIYSWWLSKWLITFVIIVVGIIAGLLAMANISRWRLMVVVSSLLYLFVLAEFSMRFLPTLENAQMWWMLATKLDSGILIIYKELLFPVVQVLILVVLLIQFIVRKDQVLINAS